MRSWLGSISVVFCDLVGIGRFGGYCCCIQCLLCDTIPVLLLFFNRECVHSVGEVTVCCHFMLKRVIEEEIDGGVVEVGLWKKLMLIQDGL